MLDVNTFPAIVRSTVPFVSDLSDGDVRTILKLAFLTAEIDLDESPEELDLLNLAGELLWELIGCEPQGIPIVSPLPLPIDREERSWRICELVSQLPSKEARELAYTIAYLFTVQDLYVARVESELLDELRQRLAIEPDRAAALVANAATIATPGATDAAPS
ncbi:MAG: hypothetical protein JWP01_2828 [Myxococcales bacterium]|nr:hypothetical protein [Myxococcales bacterium]